jgi:uncharacterized protein YjbI with pentapeptide repeats
MTGSEKSMNEEQVAGLKARWNEQNPETGETAQQEMLERLRTQCRSSSDSRPLSLDLRGITLFNADLSHLDLSGYDFSHANLSRSNLTGTAFSYAVFHNASLEQAVLDECEFLGAILTSASLNECSAKQCGFGGADLSYASMINADLNDATLSKSILVHADLRAANLQNARLSEADLSHAIFTRAKLVNSDLKHSNVMHTNFELADMQGARLLAIKNFKKAKWIGADIRGLDLRGAYLVRRYIADENYLYEFKVTSPFHKALYYLWWASSDCGRSLFRWFVWLFCATMFFAAVYTQVDIDYGDHVTWFSPVYFSFVTLTTLGYGDAVPSSFAGQFFVTLQAITGYMGLGGLLSILGNKMARRAE